MEQFEDLYVKKVKVESVRHVNVYRNVAFAQVGGVENRWCYQR